MTFLDSLVAVTESMQINSMPTDLYEGVYIGLLEVDCRPLEEGSRPMQLATSRDGRVWTRVANRAGFIEAVEDTDAWDYHQDGRSVRPSTGLFAVYSTATSLLKQRISQ